MNDNTGETELRLNGVHGGLDGRGVPNVQLDRHHHRASRTKDFFRCLLQNGEAPQKAV